MEQSAPESDACMMEGSVVETAAKGPHPVTHLHNNTSNVEEEEEELISHHNGDEEEECSQTNDEAQLDSELIKEEMDIETDAKTNTQAQTCSREHLERSEPVTDTGCDSSLISNEGGILQHSNETSKASVTPVTTMDEVVESSPSVLEGVIDTSLTLNEVSIAHDNTHSSEQQPSLLAAASSPADDGGSAESPSSSDQSPADNSPNDSTATSGISNGPSTPSSDAVGSSPASSPQTSSSTSAPSHSLSSPYDTDCSRKLLSQIQRSLSQESLLDELESELLACQLPEGGDGGERKGSPAVNGLATDQDGCMVVFEKCVQYKYAQQEKAVQR